MERQIQIAAYLAFIYTVNSLVLEFLYCMFVKGDEPSFLKLNYMFFVFPAKLSLEHINHPSRTRRYYFSWATQRLWAQASQLALASMAHAYIVARKDIIKLMV